PELLNVTSVLLDGHVDRGNAGRLAIVSGDGRTTYGELQLLTNRLGHALRRLGVQRRDRVAMRFLNGVPFAATWLAVQRIGAIGVSTMPMLRARELAYVVNDSEARVFVCQKDLLEELDKARSSFDRGVAVVTFDELLAEGGNHDPLDPQPVSR